MKEVNKSSSLSGHNLRVTVLKNQDFKIPKNSFVLKCIFFFFFFFEIKLSYI